MRTATQILQGYYTAAMCANGAEDARTELHRLWQNTTPEEQKLPGVARRIAAYTNIMLKHEGPAVAEQPEAVAAEVPTGATPAPVAVGDEFTARHERGVALAKVTVVGPKTISFIYNGRYKRRLTHAEFERQFGTVSAPATEQPAAPDALDTAIATVESGVDEVTAEKLVYVLVLGGKVWSYSSAAAMIADTDNPLIIGRDRLNYLARAGFPIEFDGMTIHRTELRRKVKPEKPEPAPVEHYIGPEVVATHGDLNRTFDALVGKHGHLPEHKAKAAIWNELKEVLALGLQVDYDFEIGRSDAGKWFINAQRKF